MMGFVNNCLQVGSRTVVYAARLLSRPCQGVLAQRAERSMKLWCLYSKLYDRHSARKVLTRLGSSLQNKMTPRSRRLLLLLSASAPLFKLDKTSMTQDGGVDEFLLQAINSLNGEKTLRGSPSFRDLINGEKSFLHMSSESKTMSKSSSWEMFIDGDSVTVWRRRLSDKPSHLCEYLVYGSYNDIQPVAFHFAQNDINYRRQWDSYTMELQLLRSDVQSRTEFIRWIVSFPFPLAPREYVLCRQSKVDVDNNMIVAINRAVPPGDEPDASCSKSKSRMVRVSEYYSVMVVVPHKTLEEPGLDFVLLYFDDPQTPSGHLASYAQSVGAGTGMRDYLTRLRKAALCLQSSPNIPRLLASAPSSDSASSQSRSDHSELSELGALSA